MIGRAFIACVLAVCVPAGASGQTSDAPAAAPAWQWHTDANAFIGLNYQHRKFTDFSEWESQNWWMGRGSRGLAGGRLTVSSMLSLEALTLRDIGSPQVFQTGETFRRAALIDYQHPHDLVMGLGAEYRRPYRRLTLIAGADLVGEPALGPAVFMHRPSARENPQVPLSHHHLDSSHITPGVLRAGVADGPWQVEASWFKGREPDENRLDLDLGALDSASLRLSWTRGSWQAQVSGAYLMQPEPINPYDAKKLTASISQVQGTETRGIAWLAAFGQSREIHGNLEAYLLEATMRINPTHAFYTRLESVAKDILDAGFHPRGTFHRHRQSQIGALTIGYVRELKQSTVGGLAIGADITGYAVAENLRRSYGSPLSFHLFLRYRAPRPPVATEVHVH